MAIVLAKTGQATNVSLPAFIVDALDDMNAIDKTDLPMGSSCYVISEGVSYILNTSKEWKVKKSTSIIYDGGIVG